VPAPPSPRSDDALMTMPPEPLEYQGPAAIAEFYLTRTWWGTRPARLVPVRATTGAVLLGFSARLAADQA
jgi:hypothetical protein